MEPRELWERHAVLAQAFCSSDDEVRRTQGLLDEAEVRRSRTLAAFAVTVGSDAVVADLLGLDEREVRLARRTVGKDDARAVAKSLLAQPAQPAHPATEQPLAGEQTVAREHVPAQPAAAHQQGQTAHPAAHPAGQAAAPGQAPTGHTGAPATGPLQAAAPQATPPQATPPQAAPPQAPPTQATAPQATGPLSTESAWAPALDAILMSSWHTGVDLTALATELGLDVRFLVARAQQLSTENRQTPQATPPDRIGRHRRMATLQSSPQSETPHLTWRERPSQPPRETYEHEPWKQQQYAGYQNNAEYRGYQEYQGYQNFQGNQSYQDYQVYQGQQPSPATWDPSAITTAQHDWDGILSQWEATTPPTPTPAPGGHGGT
ncbi:hypothetical protein [Streptomyces sp. NPDC050355]|uniref:hypothetical protein n=1 Tax=Streptomyces sp. NPDC050355 TaxID=3365609 RepID=UPI0037A1311E